MSALFNSRIGEESFSKRRPCLIEWVSGFLNGIVMAEYVYSPRLGEIIKPYGCSGKYRVLKIFEWDIDYE